MPTGVILPGEIGRMTASSGNAATDDKIVGYDTSTGLAVTFTPDQIASGASAVDGPASATNNNLARFDGTTGKIIQDSNVTVADTSGDMSGVGSLGTSAITATGAVSSTSSVTSTQFIDSTALATASTSTTMSAIGRSLLSSTAATTFPLAAPGTASGVTKFIRLTSGTTSRKIKISVSATGTVNEADTNITLSNAGDSVTLIGETSTRWGIAGSFVSGVAIATS